MRKIWEEDAWADYLYWQTQDKKTLKKINNLLKDIDRNGYSGIGKPEPLRGDKSGFWSRRIDEYNRLVSCFKQRTPLIFYLHKPFIKLYQNSYF